uniref:Uncharacterized protein n=1 Tax=Anguilla anguilla TaxID=7936 RepID=A0A0E9W7H1_ANGAN
MANQESFLHFTGNEIAHGSRRHEKGRFHATYIRCPLLKVFNSGVLSENIVANFSYGHGLAHCWPGLGDSVAPKVHRPNRNRAVLSRFSSFIVMPGRGTFSQCRAPIMGDLFCIMIPEEQ